MAWDPALLRKYNSTSHFRLLNQIRTELREQPIRRPLVTSRTAAAGFSGGGRRGGRSGGGGGGASTGGSAAVSAGSAAANAQAPAAASTHANTRRRSAAPSPLSSAGASAPRDHQPIMAVPVLTDLVLPDSHA